MKFKAIKLGLLSILLLGQNAYSATTAITFTANVIEVSSLSIQSLQNNFEGPGKAENNSIYDSVSYIDFGNMSYKGTPSNYENINVTRLDKENAMYYINNAFDVVFSSNSKFKQVVKVYKVGSLNVYYENSKSESNLNNFKQLHEYSDVINLGDTSSFNIGVKINKNDAIKTYNTQLVFQVD